MNHSFVLSTFPAFHRCLWRATLALCGVACLFAAASSDAATVLVPKGSNWKYLANGSNQGTAWRGVSFNDATWVSAPAQLGYGDGDEATVVGYGPDANNKYATTYFRRAFNVANPSAFTALTLRLLRDDGAVVYLNGVEVRRDNMPSGTVSFNTYASAALGTPQEATYYDTVIPVGSLVAGNNVLAVEIHQANGTSTDLSFDLELVASDNNATITRAPYLQVGTPNSVIVRWRTDVANNSRVDYGTNAASLTSSVNAATVTTEHEVALTGLQPNTQYYYAVGSSSGSLAGDSSYFFVTAPTTGTAKATRIWVLGDSGTASVGAKAVRDAYFNFTGAVHTDLWLMLGDNAYENGTDAEFQAGLFNLYPTMLRKSVLWLTIGNHDTASSANPPPSLPYFSIFSLPMNGEAGGLASGSEKYYSFNYGNIHFICLDSMSSNRATNGPMLTWLQNDIAATNADWIIAFWHHPPYSKGSHDSDTGTELKEMRQNALPILEAGGADLVLAGHSHSYERSFLLNGHYGLSNTLTTTMLLNNGSGRESGSGAYTKAGNGPVANGGAVYAVAGSSAKLSGGALNHPAMFISLNNLGSMVLDINGNRLDAKFLRENGSVSDSFTIIKNVANTPPSVAITSPANGASFTQPANITVTANASDNGTVTKIDFFADATLIGTDATNPYSVAWNNAPLGSHALTAVATDNSGSTTISSTVNITVGTLNPPLAPTNLAATAGNSRVTLTWSASTGATSYIVKRSLTNGGSYDVIATGVTATTFTDTNATNGTTYYYIVSAVNSGGESPDSNEASATPQMAPPSAPTNLAATAGNAQVALGWSASAGATSYNVKRATTNGGPYGALTNGIAATSHTDTTATNGTTYFYVVTAINAGGESGVSNQASATPVAPPVIPAAPSTLTASAVSRSQINLTWVDNSNNESGFKIERSTNGFSFSQIATVAPNVKTFQNTGLQSDRRYYYRVRTYNAAGNSAYSNTANAKTPRR